MLVLLEAPLATHSPGSRPALVAAAQALGHRVLVIPRGGSLAHAEPSLDRGDFQWGVLFGSGFDPARYQQLHDDARALNITLLNDPTQHANAAAFDRTVLEGLTVCTPPVPLRRMERQDGPALAREYRLFVLDADVLAMGPWVAEDPFGALTERDERELRALAHEAARRTRVPWLTADAGQLENGDWRLLETADPSCIELTAVNPRDLLGALANGLEQRAGC